MYPSVTFWNPPCCQGRCQSNGSRQLLFPYPRNLAPCPTQSSANPITRQLRPPTLSKVCETFITKWIMDDTEESIDPKQFANRNGRSTTHYLVNRVQFVLNETESGKYTNVLAIDYNKAFDQVDINIAPPPKLIEMHVRSGNLRWKSRPS